MHPDRHFRWDDEAAMRAFIADIAFAHIFAATPAGPMVAHAPVIVAQDGSLRFHLARANRLTAHIDGARVLASVVADDCYISPDWYASADQVPTWNYVAVEAEGPVRALSEADLVAQLDTLSVAQEARLLPKPPWTRAKMAPGRFEGLLKGIAGFALEVVAMRGTRKLGQNKNGADRAGVITALAASGRTGVAARMREAAE